VRNIYFKRDKVEDNRGYIADHGKVDKVETISKAIEEKTDNNSKVKFIEMANYNIISPAIQEPIKAKLMNSIENMRTMNPGVGPWRIIFAMKIRL